MHCSEKKIRDAQQDERAQKKVFAMQPKPQLCKLETSLFANRWYGFHVCDNVILKCLPLQDTL